MLKSAEWIYDDILSHKKLHTALEENPTYGLRVIGHSLGAGVAAVLGLMLRRRFPSLYCLCFSPPGCVFTSGIAAESKKFCCSFVLHDDLVPRLSYDSLVRLRNELVELIARIKVPKHCVFSTGLKPSTEQTIIGRHHRLLHPRTNIPRSEFLREYERFVELQATRKDERVSISLTLPGRIIHCVRTSASYGNTPCNCVVTCCKKIACCGSAKSTRLKARWVEPKDLTSIIISPSMLVSEKVPWYRICTLFSLKFIVCYTLQVDHFPFNVSSSLKTVADAYGCESKLHQEPDRLARALGCDEPKKKT